jgi:aminopeptidase-like protein
MITTAESSYGKAMIDLMKHLWPICRSITGAGTRESLSIIRDHLPALKILEVPTGTRCSDWAVPQEWAIRDAYVIDPQGNKIVDFKKCNLHVIGYSVPVDETMELDELQAHLFSIPDQPSAIPYVTSYYKENWGFCISDDQRKNLSPGRYRVKIDSNLFDGSLSYGELLIPGATDEEVLLSTYICHPSMANNELSGPCLATALAAWLLTTPRRYTYRLLFLPETIGAIYYVTRHLEALKEKVRAGYVLTCVGDERAWSLLASRKGNSLSDMIARHVLGHLVPEYKEYSFLERGSDERQYCSPGVDLPIASVMRSKYGTYPEYHTSLDNFELVTERGMQQSFEAYRHILEAIEYHCFPKTRILCEPKMSDRGLRSPISQVGSANDTKDMMNLIAYSDGETSLLEIANTLAVPVWELQSIAQSLASLEILDLCFGLRIKCNID